ncbi:MAG TPA: PEGA domain-containing protein [Myxococcaceae bacterium]
MSVRRLLPLAVLFLAYAPAAFPADDEGDDLLAPLTPSDSKSTPTGPTKKKKKKIPPALPPVGEKKPPPVDPLPSLAGPGKLAVRLPDAALKNAHLFVDDREVGVLPMEAIDQPPGDHKVTVKRLGYAPFNATVRVKDGGVTELLATLEPLAAVVSFSSETVGVEAFVDGKSYGPVPVNDVVVAPGVHQFRGKRDGYDEQTQTITVKAGQDYPVRFVLRPSAVARGDRPERGPKLEPRNAPPANGMSTVVERQADEGGGTPIYGQWYFWAGAGAVAAAAAGGTIWALQPKNPCGDQQCDACINAPPNLQKFCAGLTHLPLFVGVGGPISVTRH